MISLGGHSISISIFGETEEWKNAQKKDTENINSEIINNTILNFKKLITQSVCNPWNVLSRIISRNQSIIIYLIYKFK